MKRILFFCVLLTFVSFTTQAQKYDGKFKHKPALTEFEQFIVVHDAIGGDYEDALGVKSFGKQGEMWHSVAYQADQYMVDEVVANFEQYIDIYSVYKLEVSLKSENVHYFLLGYKTPAGREKFLVIEEYYHGPEDLVPVEVNSFGWTITTASN